MGNIFGKKSYFEENASRLNGLTRLVRTAITRNGPEKPLRGARKPTVLMSIRIITV
jgi:hypothetical protein